MRLMGVRLMRLEHRSVHDGICRLGWLGLWLVAKHSLNAWATALSRQV